MSNNNCITLNQEKTMEIRGYIMNPFYSSDKYGIAFEPIGAKNITERDILRFKNTKVLQEWLDNN